VVFFTSKNTAVCRWGTHPPLGPHNTQHAASTTDRSQCLLLTVSPSRFTTTSSSTVYICSVRVFSIVAWIFWFNVVTQLLITFLGCLCFFLLMTTFTQPIIIHDVKTSSMQTELVNANYWKWEVDLVKCCIQWISKTTYRPTPVSGIIFLLCSANHLIDLLLLLFKSLVAFFSLLNSPNSLQLSQCHCKTVKTWYTFQLQCNINTS